MKKEELNHLKDTLSSPQHILIIPHKNPDGDAMGSCLGLMRALEKRGHEAFVLAPNDYPEFLKWLPGTEKVMVYEQDRNRAAEEIKKASLVFTLDFNSLGRIGDLSQELENYEGDYVMIDHHQQPDDYARFTYSDPNMSSTCEMVYDFLEKMELSSEIDEQTATCLYTGIMTDTGSFRFPSTTSRTHRVIADLIDRGARNDQIHGAVFDSNSLDKLHLLGCALKNLVTLEEYHTAYISLSQEELDQHNFKKGDTEGFVNYGLSLTGIKFAVIFIENKQEGIIKISFRSKGDFSVNDFARSHFNGGGHINAAGGRSELNLEKTIEKFRDLLPRYKNELQP
ncbi:DHH family phosphoesterase [Robertkochia aurantiaca]|uniref:DHH family phosphoesterase n=1 Tax=Robertkochia aurantiaca TaxID=2873700 RepID=UPI001CD0033E|nr:bifunctional oligoribonuclease/PAP phosphatase NrnA [Robertkochia sp. 3YJGBD-33]